MAEETKETAITDAALDEAAGIIDNPGAKIESQDKGNAVSETKIEAKATEIKKETESIKKEEKEDLETDQQFRSRLGRRVSKLEDTINSFITEMRTMNQNRTVNPDPSTTSANENDYITTKADVVRVLSDLEREQKETLLRYESNYLSHIMRLGTEEGLTDKDLNRLEDLLRTSFNTTYSQYKDPTSDAEKNYLKAMRVIEREKVSSEKKEINLKHDEPLGTGISSANKIIDKSIPPVKLDQYAQDFVNYHKISEDKIRQSINEKLPERLVKK